MMLIGDLVAENSGTDSAILGESSHHFAKTSPGVFDHCRSGAEHLKDCNLRWGQLS
jgi:hypothetical protein